MVRFPLILLLVALVAAVLGFTPLVGGAHETAKLVFLVFGAFFMVSLMFDSRQPNNAA